MTTYYKYAIKCHCDLTEGPEPDLITVEFTDRDLKNWHDHYLYMQEHGDIHYIECDLEEKSHKLYKKVQNPKESKQQALLQVWSSAHKYMQDPPSLYKEYLRVYTYGYVEFVVASNDEKEMVWGGLVDLEDGYQTTFLGVEL